MQLNRNSLFYKFLTLFDPFVFLDGQEYDEEQDEWVPIYRTNTCDIIQTFITVIFAILIIAMIGLICCFAIGSELGWLAAMIATFSLIQPEPVAIVTTVLTGVFGIGVLIARISEYFQESRSNDSIISGIIKAKLNKICVPIDIID